MGGKSEIFSAPDLRSDDYYDKIIDERYGKKKEKKIAVRPEQSIRPQVEMFEDDLTEAEINSFDVEPYGDRLVVKELKISSQNGIIVEGMEEMRTNEGFVIAVGPDVSFSKVGDRVYYGLYSGTWIPRLGKQKTYRLMNEDDLLGKIKVAGKKENE